MQVGGGAGEEKEEGEEGEGRGAQFVAHHQLHRPHDLP